MSSSNPSIHEQFEYDSANFSVCFGEKKTFEMTLGKSFYFVWISVGVKGPKKNLKSCNLILNEKSPGDCSH
jgi:hypothetical protein